MSDRPVHASDIRNGRRCLRLAVLGMRTERQPARPGSAAALGTAVHGVIERYVRSVIAGVPELPDDRTLPGRIALELVPFVPADVLGAEVPFSVTWRGYLLEGTIDLVAPGAVLDWKTVGDWSRMPPTLAGDVQATFYSYAFASSGGGVPELRWRYAHTRTLSTRRLDGRIDPERIADLEPEIVALLEADATHPDPMMIPGNRAECARYGGCTFLRRCGAPPVADLFDAPLRARGGVEIPDPDPTNGRGWGL